MDALFLCAFDLVGWRLLLEGNVKKKIWLGLAWLAVLVGAVFGYRAFLIHEMRKPILAQMVDPDSAQFRDERYFGDWTGRNGILCGQVNAKNKMGGYVGFRWFTSTSEQGKVEDEAMRAVFDAAGRKRCEYGEMMNDHASWWWLRY